MVQTLQEMNFYSDVAYDFADLILSAFPAQLEGYLKADTFDIDAKSKPVLKKHLWFGLSKISENMVLAVAKHKLSQWNHNVHVQVIWEEVEDDQVVFTIRTNH